MKHETHQPKKKKSTSALEKSPHRIAWENFTSELICWFVEVTNVAPGRIIKAEADDFEALSGAGKAWWRIGRVMPVNCDTDPCRWPILGNHAPKGWSLIHYIPIPRIMTEEMLSLRLAAGIWGATQSVYTQAELSIINMGAVVADFVLGLSAS